jgi:hypothetical protein
MGRENAGDFEEFQKLARKQNYAFEKVENEFAFIPLKDNVKLQQEEFNALPEEIRSRYGEALHQLQKEFMEVSRAAGKRDTEVRKQLEKIARQQVQGTRKFASSWKRSPVSRFKEPPNRSFSFSGRITRKMSSCRDTSSSCSMTSWRTSPSSCLLI